uniref:hypothetical protein n=1 Tax=uncultured Tateyamaria sp. TaxID=455651 RepID=UPI00261CE338
LEGQCQLSKNCFLLQRNFELDCLMPTKIAFPGLNWFSAMFMKTEKPRGKQASPWKCKTAVGTRFRKLSQMTNEHTAGGGVLARLAMSPMLGTVQNFCMLLNRSMTASLLMARRTAGFRSISCTALSLLIRRSGDLCVWLLKAVDLITPMPITSAKGPR